MVLCGKLQCFLESRLQNINKIYQFFYSYFLNSLRICDTGLKVRDYMLFLDVSHEAQQYHLPFIRITRRGHRHAILSSCLVFETTGHIAAVLKDNVGLYLYVELNSLSQNLIKSM